MTLAVTELPIKCREGFLFERNSGAEGEGSAGIMG